MLETALILSIPIKRIKYLPHGLLLEAASNPRHSRSTFPNLHRVSVDN